jgi:hypothetical protein
MRRTPLLGVILTALAFGLAACGGDATAPEPTTTVTLEVTQVRGPWLGGSENQPTISCEVSLRAVATGPKAVTWDDAKLRFFAGPDRSKPVDSATVSAEEIQGSWGGATITPGQPLGSDWRFEAFFPFAIEFEHHYRQASGGALGSARTSFHCGPDVPPNAQPPQVTVTAPQSPADLELGDELTIEFGASSAVGLWQTMVMLTGPCTVRQFFSEQMTTTVTHSVRLRIPADCVLGVPIRVSVFALDIAGQEASQSVLTTIRVVDETPPTIEPLIISPWGSTLAAEAVAGDWFVGQPLIVMFRANDTRGLHGLYWEVVPESGAPVIDSVIVEPSPFNGNGIGITLRQEWVGTIRLRLFATDVSGHTSDTVETMPGAIRVRPTIERPTVSASFTGEIRDLAIDAARARVYLLQTNEARVAIVTTRLEPVVTIATGEPASDLDMSASGDSLILALPASKALGVIDLRQPELPMTKVPLTGLNESIGQTPRYLRVASNGKVFVSLAGSSLEAYRLVEASLSTGSTAVRTDAGTGGAIGGARLERSHDHSAIVFNGGTGRFQRYDAGTDSFGPGRSLIYDYRPSMDEGGTHVAAGLEVYDASLQLIRKVNSVFAEGGVLHTAISPDGQYLYQLHWPLGFIRSRVSDGALLDRTANPIGAERIRVSPDGTFLVTFDGVGISSSNVSVIDLR